MKCSHCGINFDASEKRCPICGTRAGAISAPILKPANQSNAPKPKPKRTFSALSIIVGILMSLSIGNHALLTQVQQYVENIPTDASDSAGAVDVVSPESDSYSLLGSWYFSLSEDMDAYLSLYEDGSYTLDYIDTDFQFTEQGDALIYPMDAFDGSYPDGYTPENCLTYMLDLYAYPEEYSDDDAADTLEELPSYEEDEGAEMEYLSFMVFQDMYDLDAALLCPLDEEMTYDPLAAFSMYRY